MEGRQCFVRVDDAIYGKWRTIGQLENFTDDGDIAKFLVTLYFGQKQTDGKSCQVHCGQCQRPLTLHCDICQWPAQLTTTDTQHHHHPPSSLPSSTPPPSQPSSNPLDSSSQIAESVSSNDHHTSDHAQSEKICKEAIIKDELDIDDEEQNDGDFDFPFEEVKTEPAVNNASEEESKSKSSDIALSVHFLPATGRSKRSASCTGKDEAEKTSDRGMNSDRTRASRHANKTVKAIVSKKHTQKRRKEMPHKTEGIKRRRKKLDLQFNEESSDDIRNANTSDQTQEKRKACTSQDVDPGRIIPAEERGRAEIHVYDQSFIDRHRLEGNSFVGCSGLKKIHNSQALVVKTVPKKRGRKKRKKKTLRSAEEDTEDFCIDHSIQNSHKNSDGFDLSSDNSQVYSGSEKEGQCNLEGGSQSRQTQKHQQYEDESRKDGQPFRILVSTQKVLPLLGSSGTPALRFYSYFECAHCGKAFALRRDFNNHVQKHSEKTMYKCAYCDRTFGRPSNKIIHEKRHKHECEVCGLKHLELSKVKEHMKLHDVMKCPGCPYETSDFSLFKRHKYNCHTLKPTLQCEICGVRLKSPRALSFHIAAIHQNHRPFKCELCDKSFVLRTKLNSHMKEKHEEGGKRFHCNKCGYRTFQAHNLRTHQRCVHSKERPFSCLYCPSAFALKAYLTLHLRTHTGEKPHRCGQCLQTFAQRPSLVRHIRVHHQGDPSALAST